MVQATFKTKSNEDNRVEWDLWMTSSSDRALDFLEDFRQLQEAFGDNVKFTPHYVFWECINCDASYLERDCLGGGKYCAIEPSNMLIRGTEIVYEDLRQKCLYQNLSKAGNQMKWFDYIDRVHATCHNVINEECSKRAHEKLKLNWDETISCVSGSFSKPTGWEKKDVANTIIDSEIKYWKEYGTMIYPSVVINKSTYRGQIDPLSIFNAICAGFKTAPS
jgi:hypothetical protein